MINTHRTSSRNNQSNANLELEQPLLQGRTPASESPTDLDVARSTTIGAQSEITSPKVLNCWQKMYNFLMGFGGTRAAIASFLARHISSIKPDNDFLLNNATQLVSRGYNDDEKEYIFTDQNGMKVSIQDLNEIGKKCPNLTWLSLAHITKYDTYGSPVSINVNLNECRNLTSLQVEGDFVDKIDMAECGEIKMLHFINCSSLECLVLPDITYDEKLIFCVATGSDHLFPGCERNDNAIAFINKGEVGTYINERGYLVTKCRIMETTKHKQEREAAAKKRRETSS